MKKVDRDHIDDLFRSKLYDFEVETAPEDWEAIEKRLDRPSIPFYRKHTYQWLAAAAVVLKAIKLDRPTTPSSNITKIPVCHKWRRLVLCCVRFNFASPKNTTTIVLMH